MTTSAPMHALTLQTSRRRWVLAAVLALAAIAVVGRWWHWDFLSRDVVNFLFPWIKHLGQHGFAGLSTIHANYNPPYLYLLLIGKSLLPLASPAEITKLISTLFDLALALAAAAAVHHGAHTERRLLLFFGVLALPTVWLNSATWGQCDAIYTFCLLVGLLLVERQHLLWASVAFSTAVAFKLQTAFAGPVLVAALWVGRQRFAAAATAVLAYLAWMLPSVLAGRSWAAALGVYFQQATSESELAYGAPNLWTIAKYAFADPQAQRVALIVGLVIAVGFSLFWIAFSLRLLRRSPQHVMALACTSAMVVPFLLPKMHDRYFYPADILSLVLAARDRRWMPIACLVQVGSLTAYLGYLTDLPGPPVRSIGIAANCAAVVLMARYWLHIARQDKAAPSFP